ncbi:tetratricopeptide (TPR) repeat protein [Deinobacterium chartae]|uniref:Tetratricopeptide (TPR) repeat protein n=1 Tax=Deinobacterium chartae TaxID=521158 RepID=A0A841HTL8_9DEIO|nr:tetratricopeptide repeat protein [Deinobacterium chartae]MBB6096761.1 tetratricopeptide (TPR) repeat protein [Deinobacterium chartae]
MAELSLKQAWIYMDDHEYPQAEETFRALLAHPDSAEDLRAAARLGLAQALSAQGRHTEASGVFGELRLEARARGDAAGEARALHGLARAARLGGDLGGARGYLEAEAALLSDDFARVALHIERGLLAQAGGDLPGASRHFEAAAELARATDDVVGEAEAELARADLAISQGQTAQARAHLEAARLAYFEDENRAGQLEVEARLSRLDMN